MHGVRVIEVAEHTFAPAAAMAPANVAPPVRSPTEPGWGGGGPPSVGVCTKAEPDRHQDDG